MIDSDKKNGKSGNIVISLLFFTILFYVLSWRFPKAVDWYRLYLFPIGTNTLARLMSFVPWSVGEALIIAGLFLLLFGIVIGILFLFHRKKMRRIAGCYMKFLCWVLVWVAVTETANCFVLYHATTVEDACYGAIEPDEATLVELYEFLTEQANALSEQMTRTEEGEVLYRGDLYRECKSVMQALGETYPYLRGYYPNPKPIANSDFMSQQYLSGIYFPFTLEANYNQTMHSLNRPAAICHELSHLKGVILEDEANYFGFLACIASEDKFLAYSGYLSVLPYVGREVAKTVSPEMKSTLIRPNALVLKDGVFLTEEEWNRVERNALFETETVNKVTNAFLEGNLKTNGVEDGMVSYSRVVKLLCAWYQTSYMNDNQKSGCYIVI